MQFAKMPPGSAFSDREEAARKISLVWLITNGLLLVILAAVGVLLWFTKGFGLVPNNWFYAFLTLHGTGMVAVSLMTIAAVYWFLMSKELSLSPAVNGFVYVLVMLGVVLVLVATLVGRFGTGWTFLYPLPSHPGPIPGWASGWTVPFLVGLALVVVAFAVWCLDFLRAGLAKYGTIGKMLGLDVLTGRSRPGDPGTTDPPTAAGTVMSINGLITAVPGAVIVVLMLVNAFHNAFTFNTLLAKELIFFTGHMLVNIEIYLGAGVVYIVLPAYAKRPWLATRVVVVGWLATGILIMLPFFHHLYQDFAQPLGLAVVGNVGSYASAVPAIVVTIFGGVLIVYRSGMKWLTAPLFAFAALAGWAIGGFGALIDSTPGVNQYLHNTLWVPAHFHTYMALGVMLFVLGGLYHAMPGLTGRPLSERMGRLGATLILVGGWGVVLTFFVGGALSVPRRYAFVPISTIENPGRVAFVLGLVALLGMLVIFGDFVRSVFGRPNLTSEAEPSGTPVPGTLA